MMSMVFGPATANFDHLLSSLLGKEMIKVGRNPAEGLKMATTGSQTCAKNALYDYKKVIFIYRNILTVRRADPQILSSWHPIYTTQVCPYSAPPRKNFFSQFVENVRQELHRNKDMKENLKKFREEAERLEQSDALKKARQKYDAIESETTKGSQQLKEQLDSIKGKIFETLDEAQKSDIGKKSREITGEFVKSARSAAEAVAKQSENLGNSSAFKTVSEGVKVVKQEIDESAVIGGKMYKPLKTLRKRSERTKMADDRHFTANTEAMGVELHKDSKWSQSWQSFKENNSYVNKIFDWKMKFDESDNPVVRASRVVTDKVTDLFGGLFQKTELSEVLTEIVKIDPTFDKEKFLKECELEIIPNILEAIIRGDLEILKDWCHEAAFNALATPIKQAITLGYKYDNRILDISNVDLAMGKMMEQGPVLILTFQTQQIMVVKNNKGDVVEGDPEKILRMHYVWVLCRDQSEFDPKAAWRLMDLSANSAQQWL